MLKGLYDRQLDTELFKRLHATRFYLKSLSPRKNLGPGSYNPRTIDEIYRQKSCSKYGRYFQQSKRFSSINSTSRLSCCKQTRVRGLGNIPDELQRKNDFKRRHNAIRLDLQSRNYCRQQRKYMLRAPPVTLYEKRSFVDELVHKKTGIYGPFFKSAPERSHKLLDWYKGPAHLQDRMPPTILDLFFSKSNRYKGKFLPIPSNVNRNLHQVKSSPGPTTYFNDFTTSQRKSHAQSYGFLSSTERFSEGQNAKFHRGPVSYNPDGCPRSCHTKRNK